MKTNLMVLILFFSLSVYGTENGDVTINWKDVSRSYSTTAVKIFDDSIKVGMFESVVLLDDDLFYQTQNENKETQILRVNLVTEDKQIFPLSEGKILGWTTYKKELLMLVKNKLLFLNPKTLLKRSEIPISISSGNFHELVVQNDTLYLFQKEKVYVYNIKTGEKEEERYAPFKSIQRVLRLDDQTLLLYSSFWGNRMKVIDAASFAFKKDLTIPTNHRSLFKMVFTQKKRFLVADPITKNYSEWMEFGGRIIEVSAGLQISASPPAVRYSPIENLIEYKIKITAKEKTPETVLNFVLPKLQTYSQKITEEKFSKSSEIKLDSFGNRILSLPISAMNKDDVFEHSPYKAKLTRYKISFDLRNLKTELSKMVVPEYLNRYMTNNSSLKYDDGRVITKRNEVIADTKLVVDVLNKTQTYVASIPYKSGAFQSAPFVIEKNNGACTEHSYVTMAFLRSLGIPSRLIWNYLPTESSKNIFLNHKFVEAWLPNYGWIPLEPLSSPSKIPGSTNAQHVIFAGLEKTSLEDIAGGDRLFNFNKKDLGISKKMTIRFDIIKSGISEEDKSTPVKSKASPINTADETIID